MPQGWLRSDRGFPHGRMGRFLGRGWAALGFAGTLAAAAANYPGTIDEGFPPVEFASEGFGGSGVTAVAVQADRRVLVGGEFTSVGGVRQGRLARLNPDGSLDGAFRPVISKQDSYIQVNEVVVQPDGRILVAGRFDSVNGYRRYGLARLNADGSLDPSFAPKFDGDNDVGGVSVLPSGRIIFHGFIFRIDGQFRESVVRTGGTGKLDPSFTFDDSLQPFVHGLLPLRNGQYLVWGFMGRWVSSQPTSTRDDRTLFRIADSGAYDPVFSGPWTGFEWPAGVVEQKDGRLLVVGDFDHVGDLTRYGCARLLANGRLDPTFLVGGPTSTPSEYPLTGEAIALQADGKVLLGATFNADHRLRLVRLLTDGTFDAGFTPVELDYGPGNLRIVPDGETLYVGGSFVRVNGAGHAHLVRIHGGELREAPPAIGRVVRDLEGRTRIEFAAVPTHRYRIEASVNLADWEEAESLIAGQAAMSWTDERTAEFPYRFYRVCHLGGPTLSSRP